MTDSELTSETERFTNEFLGILSTSGKCYMVSVPLKEHLAAKGLKSTLKEGSIFYYGRDVQHFWLELGDGRILDATANQFNKEGHNMPQTYLGIKPEHYGEKLT